MTTNQGHPTRRTIEDFQDVSATKVEHGFAGDIFSRQNIFPLIPMFRKSPSDPPGFALYTFEDLISRRFHRGFNRQRCVTAEFDDYLAIDGCVSSNALRKDVRAVVQLIAFLSHRP